MYPQLRRVGKAKLAHYSSDDRVIAARRVRAFAHPAVLGERMAPESALLTRAKHLQLAMRTLANRSVR
jgi:hypothetical protein